MKKFDYFCMIYSLVLLIFGFKDDVPNKNASQALESAKKERQIVILQPVAENRPTTTQSASFLQAAHNPPQQIRTIMAK